MTTKKRRQSLRTQKAPSTQSTAATTAVTVATTKTRKSSAKYTRPGVEAAANLVSLLHNNCNNDTSSDHDTAVIDTWERASSCYASMIKAKGGAKLVKLDKQRDDIAKGWNTTSKSSKSRSASSSLLSKEQLLDIIIEWKFTKGKPRHALKPLLKSNAHESVRSAVKRAFETANGIPANNNGGNNGKHHGKQITLAMKHLCELKGVGPATASSILCMYRPDVFAFMDDEVIECLYDGKRGYTMKIYMEVNDRCGEIADVLNNEAKKRDVHGDDGGNGEDKECFWTPCRVGKALWTVATMSAVNVEDGLNAIFEEGKKKKSRSIQNSRKKAKKS